MAYTIGATAGKAIGKGTAAGGRRGGGNGTKQAGVELVVQTPDGDYLCQSSKTYTEKSSIIQDLDSSDGFINLCSFSNTVSALTVHNAKVIIVKNISNVASEIAITTYGWRNDSGGTTADVQNSVDLNEENSTGEETTLRTWSMILPANEFFYLPTSRLIGYSPLAAATLESAGNSAAGAVAIEPKDINSGNEYKIVNLFAGSTYASGAGVRVDGEIASTITTLVVDDGDWFKVGDLLFLGNSELVEVEAISGTSLTIKRGLLGTNTSTVSNNSDINYFFGNEYLPYDDGKCMTDANGRFSQKGAFFGYGRSADKVAEGLVAGSIAIGPFYTNGGYLNFGLQGINASDETGLVASTAYTFHIVVDEFNSGGFDSTSTEAAIAFTTDSSDTSFSGSAVAVIPKIQAIFDSLYYDASSGLFNKRVSIGLYKGDIRITSHSNNSDTRVGIGNVSGTSPFAVGRFPGLSSSVPAVSGAEFGGGTTDTIVYGPASSLGVETFDDSETGKTIKNTNAFIYDDGKGNLLHNNGKVGSIDYAKGHCEFQVSNLPKAEFKVYAETLAAHSGGVNWNSNGQNTLYTIDGRSLKAKQDSKIEVVLLG